MSVDSFINIPEDHNSSVISPESNAVFNKNSTSEYNSRPRNHKSSITSTGDPDASLDSDFERSDLLQRYRHTSLKNSSRPHIRGGDLLLPSRTPPIASTSSVNKTASTSTTTTSSTMDISQQYFLSSTQSIASRSTSAVASGRLRSGSGTFMNNKRYRHTNNYKTTPSTSKTSSAPCTIIVVGTAGCGKSSVIENGVRGRLSDASVPIDSIQGTSTRCSHWDGELSHEGRTVHLRVIEIDVPSEHLKPADPPEWPESSSAISGVLICYDASQKSSFNPVPRLLRVYHDFKLPICVLACKTDLPPEVNSQDAHNLVKQYDVGLIEVGRTAEDNIRKAFSRLYIMTKGESRDKAKHRSQASEYQNPTSSAILYDQIPLDGMRGIRSAPQSSTRDQAEQGTSPTTPSPSHLSFLSSPTRTRSAGTLYEQEYVDAMVHPAPIVPSQQSAHRNVEPEPSQPNQSLDRGKDEFDSFTTKERKEKEVGSSRPGQWATLDDLLNKLLFLAVSGDVLKMQSRIRELDEKSSGDPMFACFAQMRICHLLELWMRDYPHDFAVRGTASALSALITSIISKTHLLHYGSEFLPFLEILPTLADHDATWAVKIDTTDENDDIYEDDEVHPSQDLSSPPSPVRGQLDAAPPPSARDRKSSFPLSSMLAPGPKVNTAHHDGEISEKQQIKDLLKVSQEIQMLEPEEIAQEITRIEAKLFLDIKPRHWLSYTFVSGKKDESDPISVFNAFSNHLADWVVSLILCHKTPRARVRQIEKFVEIAQRLRALNNYSALRAFVAGINNATFSGDETMEQFKARCPDHAKNLRSWDLLLQHIRSHRAYRLALRNSKGACIPALEVHMSDLIRAHEGNDDFYSSDSSKIHWGKFNMMGRFISSTAQCQAQCRTAPDYSFVERNHIRELLAKPVMSHQMQKSRIAPIDAEGDEHRVVHSTVLPPRDAAILRKLIFW
ncbi:hypothetical protein H0H93_002938 [Arthromyces matolae]|nr:hypothetical protein H0H93_002938 [Arthromyces matolae]